MKKNKPLFISFEGPDGSGKSTVSKKFFEYLKNKNIPVIWTREPGGTNVKISESIRQILLDSNNHEINPKTEALLFAASRAQHVNELIKPNIKNGINVICDRYIHSSLAYQGFARGLGIKEVYDINKFAIDKLMPDIVFFINVPFEVGLQRIIDANREMDRMDKESTQHHKMVYEGYMKTIKKVKSNYVIIDGTKTPDEVLQQVINEYEKIVG